MSNDPNAHSEVAREINERHQWVIKRIGELMDKGHAYDDANWIAMQEAFRQQVAPNLDRS